MFATLEHDVLIAKNMFEGGVNPQNANGAELTPLAQLVLEQILQRPPSAFALSVFGEEAVEKC